jgi:transposase
MTKPYSMDLRERVVAAVEAGQSRRAVAKLFNLGPATVVRWVERQRTSGACAPKPMGGVRHAVLLPERDWLLARIAAVPDATVRALRMELAERGTKVSNDAVWRFLRNERLTFKKKSAGRRAGPA